MNVPSFLLLVIVTLLVCTSCVQHRQLVNFRKGDESTLDGYMEKINGPELRVQSNDILYIMVNSLDDKASEPFNLMQNTQRGGGGGNNGQNNQLLLQGYAVDSSGYIDFPTVGRLNVAGKSLEGVRALIEGALTPYFANNPPAINVKFLNFRYTIIGDVQAPGTYTTINDRISLLEALGTAGDFTSYADRQSILVIREKDGVRTIKELDLQDKDFFSSPYYYLQQNDVIYIEPTEAKVATVADPVSRLISYGSAFLSLVTLALTVFTR